jgi:hypothetical protein
MARLRNGHAPGHVREAACNAFEAWMDWDGTSPEPTVEYEIDYELRQIPISRAIGLVHNCTDIMPGNLFHELQDTVQSKERCFEPVIKRHTYAACARYVLEDIKASLAAMA